MRLHRFIVASLVILAACSKKQDEPASRPAAGSANADAGARIAIDLDADLPFDPALIGLKLPDDGGAPPSDLPPDAPYEGTIAASVSEAAPTDTDQEPPPARYQFTLKGRDVRWDLFGPQRATAGWRIYRGEEHRFYTVVPDSKAVFVGDETKMQPDAGAPRSWKFSVISKVGRVAGHDCERWSTRDATHRYDMCVARDLVPFPLHLLGGAIGEAIPFNDELQKQGLFPLAATRFAAEAGGRDGGRTLPDRIFAVTEIVRRKVAPENFRIPNEYPKIPRDNMTTTRKVLF